MATDAELADRCVSILKQAFTAEGDTTFWAKMHAAEALTGAGQGQWVKDTLGKMLKSNWNAQQMCGLCREMVRAGAGEYEQRMVEALERPEQGGATHAAESLFKVGKVGRRDLMEKTAGSDDAVLSMMACAALVRAGDRERLGAVREKLGSSREREAVVACWVLGQLGDASDVERIEKAMAAWTGDARFNAEIALARLGKKGMEGRLFEMLKDESETRVAGVCEALAAMKVSAAREHLVKLLDDPRLDVRVRASQALLGILRK